MLLITDMMDTDSSRYCVECLDFLTTCMVCEQPFQCATCTHFADDLHTECVISDEPS